MYNLSDKFIIHFFYHTVNTNSIFNERSKRVCHLQKNLRDKREEKGLTQGELAKAVGIAQPQIAKYENGIQVPNAITVVQIAKQLGTTAEQLVD